MLSGRMREIAWVSHTHLELQNCREYNWPRGGRFTVMPRQVRIQPLAVSLGALN